MFDQLFAQLTQTLNALIGQGLGFVVQLIWLVTSVIWTLLDRSMAFVGAQVEAITHELSTSVFAPLIQQLGGSLSKAVNISWIIALCVLAICYLMAGLAKIRVVTARSVVGWYVVAVIFFQIGPQLYSTMDDFRASIQGTFYGTTLSYFQGAMNVNPLGVISTGSGVTALGLTPMCDNFGGYIGHMNGYINGLDVALAFLRADGYDVMGYSSTSLNHGMCATGSTNTFALSIPRSWYDAGSFFDADHLPGSATSDFSTLTLDKQTQVATNALSALPRLLIGVILLAFGIIEQIVNLCLAFAEGMTFVSFSIALLFSFFKRTEPIALAMIDQWLSLIVQTVIIALLQALVVGFLVALAASRGNPVVAVGVALVGMIIEALVIKSALSAILNTFDGLFKAFGRATGGAMGAPSALVGSMVGAGMTMATGGLAGAAMLVGGGTAMQTAGAAFGDSQALTGAMRSLARMPQGRDTDWGDAASEFVEGAAFRGIGEAVGGRAIGAPVGSYIGGRLLNGSGPQNGIRSGSKTGSDAETEVVEGEVVDDVSFAANASSAAAGLPAGVRLPAVPETDSRMAKRSAAGLSTTQGGETDYIDGEILPDDPLVPMRTAEGFFQPSKPLLMLDPGGEPGPVVDALNTDEQRLEQSGKSNAAAQISDADTNESRLGMLEESDEERSEGVAASVAHDEELTMRQAMQGANTQGDAAAMTASILLNTSATQLTGAASAMMQVSQRAGISERREDVNRQLAEAEGTLSVGGSSDVAATLANLVDSLRQAGAGETTGNRMGVPGAVPDFMTISRGMAEVTGMSPVATTAPMQGGQMASVGLFAQQALRMGLDGEAVQQVVNDIKDSPDGSLRPATRQTLARQLVEEQGYSERSVNTQLDTLESYAQAVPDTLQVYGARQVAVGQDGTLSAPSGAPSIAPNAVAFQASTIAPPSVVNVYSATAMADSLPQSTDTRVVSGFAPFTTDDRPPLTAVALRSRVIQPSPTVRNSQSSVPPFYSDDLDDLRDNSGETP